MSGSHPKMGRPCLKRTSDVRERGTKVFMSEHSKQSSGILVPKRYLPGNSQRFFDDFFEMAIGPMPPPPTLEDGSQLALTKYYFVACCPVAGAYNLPDGLLNLILRLFRSYDGKSGQRYLS